MTKDNRNKKNEKDYQEKIIKISRVSKTVKGGRRISFSVMAGVGDENGNVGIGLGKANGVPDAIKKAIAVAKKNMINVSMAKKTIPHAIEAKVCSTKVVLLPASEGTGVIAGSAVREVVELAGVHDILTKVVGSKNKLNVAKATIKALETLRSPDEVAKIRGKKVEEILS